MGNRIFPALSEFLSFPLSLFVSRNYGWFSKYKNEPDWILTEKGVVRNAIERYSIRQDMKAFDKLLNHSVIILNTYSKFYTPENQRLTRMYMEGTSLVIEILALLQKIETYDQSVHLRWYLNPAKEEILHELKKKETRYFFAAFEADEEPGMWQTGEGQRTSYMEGK